MRTSRFDSPTSPARSGYALPLTLILCALVAIALSAVARRSIRNAADADRAAVELQFRWGTQSIQRSLPALSNALLERPPRGSVQLDIRLGGESIRTTLSDESTKLNLAQVQRDEAISLRPVQSAAAAARIQLLSLESWPSPQDAQRIGPFGFATTDRDPDRIDTLLSTFTVWGDGKLHVHRTPSALLRRVVEPHLDGIALSRFMGALEQNRHRPSNTRAGLSSLLGPLGVNEKQRAALDALLSETPGAYSIRTQLNRGGFIGNQLIVHQSGAPQRRMEW